MQTSKRIFDIFTSTILIAILAPLILVISLFILIMDGRPVFYVSERMKTVSEGFLIVKFRTMKPDLRDFGVSGGEKNNRITQTGFFLRRTRLDELPQLWNVIRGDISFVGPRPPLRQYVERFPSTYRKVLSSRPGITGLASVYFSSHEEYLLSRTKTREETDYVYCRRCIPYKARLDFIYQKNQNLCFDVIIMLKTVFKILR